MQMAGLKGPANAYQVLWMLIAVAAAELQVVTGIAIRHVRDSEGIRGYKWGILLCINSTTVRGDVAIRSK